MADITDSQGGDRAARLAAAINAAMAAVPLSEQEDDSPALGACDELIGVSTGFELPEPLVASSWTVRRWFAVGLRAGAAFAREEPEHPSVWHARLLELMRERDGAREDVTRLERLLRARHPVLAAAVAWRGSVAAFTIPNRTHREREVIAAVDAWLATEDGKAIAPDRLVAPLAPQGQGEPADVENATIGVDASTSGVFFAPRLGKTAGARVVRTTADELADDGEHLRAHRDLLGALGEKPKRRPLVDRILGRVCRLESRQGQLAERVKRLEEIEPTLVRLATLERGLLGLADDFAALDREGNRPLEAGIADLVRFVGAADAGPDDEDLLSRVRRLEGVYRERAAAPAWPFPAPSPGTAIVTPRERHHVTVKLPEDPVGVCAVGDTALRRLCLELAWLRLRSVSPAPPWRGDAEEVRLVWDEFLSGHDARLLP